MTEPESPAPALRVSDDLRRILELAGGEPMSVEDIIRHTHGRGLQTIAIVLCLPFLSPVAIPGLSIPFGIAIAICGIRIAFRHRPWLPEFIAKRRISSAVLDKTLRFGIAIHTRLEKFLRVRWLGLVDSRQAQMAAGFAIALSAFLLSLPIPPPFPLTNTIPGFAIIMLCLGMLERDGLVTCFGYVLTVLSAAYVILIAALGGAGAAGIWHWIGTFG
ncbi:MAG: exopolysaccharide biosynthesis protein [Verrucomicrobia bacterium]|nr:exopolysaccharide biosynthesis protein [Verrucomicrobiota bacterium]